MTVATSLTEIDLLRIFVRSVVIRAKHHADNLDEIALTLAGAILWKKDADAEIKARKNILWVVMNGVRYCFAYVQGNGGTIEIREGSQTGEVVYFFTNENTAEDVKFAFEEIKPDPTWEEFLAEGGNG